LYCAINILKKKVIYKQNNKKNKDKKVKQKQ